MKKGTVGKIVIFTVAGGILALSTKSCISGYIAEANFKRDRNTKPTTSNSDTMTQPTSLDVTESSFVHDNGEYVNENVYSILLSARNKYESLLNGTDSVSEKLINTGVKLNANDSGHIDSSIKNIYDLICGYVSSYEKKDYDACYNYAFQLNEYSYDITNKYLYDLLVKNNIESKYQSDIKYDEFGSPVYQFGNISLENGSQIRFIGGDDSIVNGNNMNDFSSRIMWLEEIPAKLFDRYSQIKNSNDDGVCYVINVTKAYEYCIMETNKIISEYSSVYNVNAEDISIKEFNGEFYFTNSNGELLGLLDYNQKNNYEKIKYIKDSELNGNTDCLLLDSYVSELYNNQSSNSYNK